MRAIRVREFGGPELLRLEEVPDPQPGPSQVVVRIKAAGVNPVDTYIRAGIYPRKPPLPYTPGADGAGIVESVGEGVARVKPGERVYVGGGFTGTYAELALFDELSVWPLPAHISFPQGAGVNVPYVTAFRGLFQRAHARGGETVLIQGASGGVGIAAVQLARAAGLDVTGTAGTDRGRQLVADEGAHAVLDHTAPDHFEKALAQTKGRGYDVILEMLANVNLGRDLPLLAAYGRVVVIGSRGTVEINPRDTMMRDAAILGVALPNISRNELIAIHSAIVAGLENKSLRPVVGQEIPLPEAPRAHAAVMKAGSYGKIVLIP
jgi:NADPH2:quinone reductase